MRWDSALLTFGGGTGQRLRRTLFAGLAGARSFTAKCRNSVSCSRRGSASTASSISVSVLMAAKLPAPSLGSSRECRNASPSRDQSSNLGHAACPRSSSFVARGSRTERRLRGLPDEAELRRQARPSRSLVTREKMAWRFAACSKLPELA